MKLSLIASIAAAAAATALPASSANVFQTDLLSITASGVPGSLRPGSIWSGVEGPIAALSSVVDGAFVAPNTQWTLGTFWWDELLFDARALNPVVIEITLNSTHTVNRFVVQGDDNEDYIVEYWDGASWVQAFNAASFGGPGMETRDSGLMATVTSDRFRVFGFGGDSYYSVSEIQAFDAQRISEPAGLALAAVALGMAALRRRKPRREMQRPGSGD